VDIQQKMGNLIDQLREMRNVMLEGIYVKSWIHKMYYGNECTKDLKAIIEKGQVFLSQN